MTTAALLPKAALVNIDFAMTVIAPCVGLLVRRGQMTLLARNGGMLTEQREIAQVVIEADVEPPATRRMAGLALLAKSRSMNVVGRVAAGTLCCERLLRNWRGMARMTGYGRMLAFEDVLGIRVMIESRRLESIIAVAISTCLSESASVSVLGEMATVAVFRQFIFIPARLVTACTGCIRVHAQQGESCFLLVIEASCAPSLRRMTRSAVIAPGTSVGIVGRVAGSTSLRGIFIAIAKMTRCTGNLGVPVRKRKLGLVMVIASQVPCNGVMAACTVLAKTTLVRLVILVAAVAARCSLSIEFSLLVAAGTR